MDKDDTKEYEEFRRITFKDNEEKRKKLLEDKKSPWASR